MPNNVRYGINMYHSMGVYMQITVKAKKNYGQVMFYPVCKLAEQFAEMVGQKTLTLKDLEKIKAMEVGIVVTYEEVNI